MTDTSPRSRRAFVSALSWLAGLATTIPAGRAEAGQAAATPAGIDLAWVDELQGRHMLVFDMADTDPAGQPPPLRLPRNYMDGFRDVYRQAFPDVRTLVGISGRAFPVNASDRLWKKYGLGERSKIIDPATKLPAERNIYLDDPSLGVKALQARGTIFWQCAIALDGIAGQLAAAHQLPVAEVRADLAAGLNPGVRIVPGHVMALGLVQERGVGYAKI